MQSVIAQQNPSINKKLKQRLQKVSIAFGLLVCSLGALVILGWYTNNTLLVQIHPSFVPMQFNTALGFLLCGIGLLAIYRTTHRISLIAGVIVAILGFLTLLQYIFGVDFRIDQLLMQHYITTETSTPGRMAPNTALAFTLSGIALVYRTRVANSQQSLVTQALLGSTILALGTIAFFGYLGNIETAFGWGELTRMAAHTSVGFILIGFAFILQVWETYIQSESQNSNWISIIIFNFGLIFSILIWQALVNRDITLLQEGVLATEQESTPQSQLSLIPTIILIAGIVVSTLLTLTIHYARKAIQQSRDLIIANTSLASEHNILRTLLDTIPDPIFVKDKESRFITGNQRQAYLLGVDSPSDLVGKTEAELIPERDEETRLEEQQVLATGLPLLFKEAEIKTIEGQSSWQLTSKFPIKDKQGKITGLVGIGRDITEQKNMLDALYQSEERYRTVVDNQTEMMVRYRPDGTVIFANQPYCDHLQVTFEELEGRSFLDFVLDRDKVIQTIQKVLETKASASAESLYITPDGETHWHAWYDRPILDEDGEVIEILGVGRDITEQITAQRELQAVFDGTFQFIGLLEPDGNY